MPDKPVDDDDDFELELEPVDPDVVAHVQQRARAKTDEAISSVDADELFRKPVHSDLSVDWQFLSQFRFSTRHLLMLTAILAIILTLQQQLGGCNSIFIVAVVLLGAGWFYVLRVEQKQDAERARQREEFLAQMKAGKPATPLDATTEAAASPISAEPFRRWNVKVSFSLKEIFITMTVAAVVLGLIRAFGANNMAIVLGLIALIGLVVQAAGFDAPRMVVLGWWMLLVLYLLVGLVAAIVGEDDTASRSVPQSNVAIAATILLHDFRSLDGEGAGGNLSPLLGDSPFVLLLDHTVRLQPNGGAPAQ
jgi:hypothetical protein